MTLYRIGSTRYPLLSGEGARLTGGRWNEAGLPVIYAADTISTAILEYRVHLNGVPSPPSLGWISIEIPHDASIVKLDVASLPGWDDADSSVSRDYGSEWLRTARSLVLLVPSVAASGLASNALINPMHRDFQKVTASEPRRITLDARLFDLTG